MVSRGCLVGERAPSLLLPCVAESVREHDLVLVRHLLTQTLDREKEKKRLEKEKEDGQAVVVRSSPVVGTLPAQSVVPSSATVVSVTDIIWQEARWNWYRAQAHSLDPGLSQFHAPVVTSSCGALSVGSTPKRPLLVSRFGATGFRRMKVCIHLYRRVCHKGEWCSFARSSSQLHQDAERSQYWLAYENLTMTSWNRALEAVDGVRDGKPPGVRGAFQILGIIWRRGSG